MGDPALQLLSWEDCQRIIDSNPDPDAVTAALLAVYNVTADEMLASLLGEYRRSIWQRIAKPRTLLLVLLANRVDQLYPSPSERLRFFDDIRRMIASFSTSPDFRLRLYGRLSPQVRDDIESRLCAGDLPKDIMDPWISRFDIGDIVLFTSDRWKVQQIINLCSRPSQIRSLWDLGKDRSGRPSYLQGLIDNLGGQEEKILSQIQGKLLERRNPVGVLRSSIVEWCNGRPRLFDGRVWDVWDIMRYFSDMPEEINRFASISADSAYRQVFLDCVNKHWSELEVAGYEYLLRLLDGNLSAGGLSSHLTTYLPGLREPRWLDAALDCIHSLLPTDFFRHSLAGYALEALKRFTAWRRKDVDRIFIATEASLLPRTIAIDLITIARRHLVEKHDRAVVGLALLHFHHAQVAEDDKPDLRSQLDACRAEIESDDQGASVNWLGRRWQMLPIERQWQSGQEWERLGPGGKAEWRRDVAEHLQGQGPLRRAFLEFSLHFASAAVYADIEPLLIALIGDDDDFQALAELCQSATDLVKYRARALRRLVEGGDGRDDLVARTPLQAAAWLGAGVATGPVPRTWLGDTAAEMAVFNAVRRVEAEFCRRYEQTWHKDEPVHLAGLLTRLDEAFARANHTIHALWSDAPGIAPKVSLNYRQPSQREEGGPGVRGTRFSVDVAFLVVIHDAGTQVTRRAAFVQAKKRVASDRAGRPVIWDRSATIDRQQCSDLMDQTESSFYLFLGPEDPVAELPVMPARLVANLAELHRRGGQTLPLRSIQHASRSLAHWLTYDLLGLWTGDDDPAVLDKAEGRGPGFHPEHMVTITVHRRPGREG